MLLLFIFRFQCNDRPTLLVTRPSSIGILSCKALSAWANSLSICAITVCDKEDQVQSMQSIPVYEFIQSALMQMKNFIENY